MVLLVTGANGFLGSALITQARKDRIPLRGTDKDAAPCLAELEYLQADMLKSDFPPSIFAGVGTVIHAAGLAHIFNKAQGDRAPFREVNEIGTANIAQAAARAGVRHFVLVSSVSVYGGSREGGGENSKCFPDSPYSESKYRAELCAMDIARASGMGLTILRLATLYGEGDPGNVARLMRSIDRSRFLWVGDGSNRKSLLHREDAAKACLIVAQRPTANVNVFNVSAAPCSMRDVVENLAGALGKGTWPVHVPAHFALGLASLVARMMYNRLGHMPMVVRKWLSNDVYDAGKFEKTFGFKAQVSLEDGLRREVAWYRSQHP